MSTEESKDKRDQLKKELTELQRRLNETNILKESSFEKKHQITKQISEFRAKINESKHKRDMLTKEVKELKEKRKELNDVIITKISEIKEIDKDKKEVLKKNKVGGNPELFKKEIEKLEFRIETEGMSFSKEQLAMKQIHNLKKQLNEIKETKEVMGKGRGLSREIDELKQKADDVHTEIQTKAKESQENHELMIGLIKKIDELKKEEKEAFKKFMEGKQEFTKINDELKSRLGEMNEISVEVHKGKKQRFDKRKEQDQRTLAEKRIEVEEKLKRGDKLNNEDLLVLQGTDSED
jgi:uncharacterized coiled-coil DUF342 family protein